MTSRHSQYFYFVGTIIIHIQIDETLNFIKQYELLQKIWLLGNIIFTIKDNRKSNKYLVKTNVRTNQQSQYIFQYYYLNYVR